MTPPGPRRIVLVGFMGSGKSTVGRLVAEALGWSFVDLDDFVEGEQGRSVRQIFREDGEPFFREIEGRLAETLMSRDDIVLATGGGWAARPGRLASVPDGTVTVWLQVSAGEAIRRTRGAGGIRPLLDVPDPQERAGALLEARRAFYGGATFQVDTEGLAPEDVSRRIVALVGVTRNRSS